MKPIVFDEEAQEELDAAMAHYEAVRKGLGKELLGIVRKACELVQLQPQLCQRHEETEFRRYPLRRFPYTLFYLETDNDIWVAAFAHQKREPGYWKDRQPP